MTVTSVCSRSECTQSTVVWLDHSCRDLWAGPNCEAQFGFLAVIHTEALKHKAPKARTCTSSAGIEHHETLQASAIVCKLANAVQAQIDDFLPNRVMPTSKVVSSVLLT